MTHPFLSTEWMAAVHAIRDKYAGQTPEIPQTLKINQVVTGAPFGDGTVETHLDTSSGSLTMDFGLLEDADVTVTTDYDTARVLFVDQDPAAGMQAFMSGKVTVQGDMMKLMTMQTAMPANDATIKIGEEIKAITERAEPVAAAPAAPAPVAADPAPTGGTPADAPTDAEPVDPPVDTESGNVAPEA